MVASPVAAGDMRVPGLMGAPPAAQFFRHDAYDVGVRARPARLNGHRGRGTSLERTEKERRIQISPNGTSGNVGDTALASPPAPRRTPTPADVIAKNPPTEGVRATYRAWRYPLPGVASEKVWSIDDRGGDDDQGGRVEKLITEAMAGAEPNNRSRKASHSLGFFKEGLPEDRTKKQARGRGRSKEGSSPIKLPRGLDASKILQDQYSRDPVQRIQTRDIPAEDGQRSSTEGGLPSSVPAPKQTKVESALTGAIPTADGYVDATSNTETPKEQVRALPPQLLAEIRKHHNLTPGATKGTSFSQSLPVTESERPRGEEDQSQVGSMKSTQKSEDGNEDGAELSPVKSADEEDESGEEQISSAIFVPHQSSRDSPEENNNVLESVPDQREREGDHRSVDASNLKRWLEQYEIPSRDASQNESKSQPVPVSSPVRVKQPGSRDEGEGVGPEAGDVSLAEQERANDSGAWEEVVVDDDDLTPLGSMKPDSFFTGSSSHGEVQDPKRPVEAIELIPYRHQVGGHTTLWRFSKRAVCKQLSNRENEFYETVEHYHPQLLKFLPRSV